MFKTFISIEAQAFGEPMMYGHKLFLKLEIIVSVSALLIF